MRIKSIKIYDSVSGAIMWYIIGFKEKEKVANGISFLSCKSIVIVDGNPTIETESNNMLVFSGFKYILIADRL